MANQIITNCCNADCAFCFAADSRRRMLKSGSSRMDETEVRSWLDFTMKAGISELRLLGGEPTIHPNFADFVKVGREAGCSILVFSNGVMPDASREALAALDPEVCTVVVNMNAAIREGDAARRRDTLEMLGPRVIPGMTLTSPDFHFHAAVAAIEAFGLRKSIRIGISNPTWRGTNSALHPKRYRAIGRALFEKSFMTAKYGISLEADCGFVRCMFGNDFEQLTANGFKYISRCTPVLDLCTGGKILPCFGLSNLLSADRDDFTDAGAAYEWFTEKLKPWRKIGIYPECTECRFFETDECCGGCLSARLRRLQPFLSRDL